MVLLLHIVSQLCLQYYLHLPYQIPIASHALTVRLTLTVTITSTVVQVGYAWVAFWWGAEDGSPKAGNRVELEAMLEQVHHNKQTAQMAMLTAHKERVEWDHEGGQPPLHSHFGQVRSQPPRTPLRPHPRNHPCPSAPFGRSA